MTPTTFSKRHSFATRIALLISLFLLPLWPKPPDDNSQVKFAVRTELVLIPTVATDKSGNHITGLKRENFTVLEDGAEQKIATFDEITSAAQRVSRPDVPDEFSNAIAADPTTRRVTLIVLDLINTRIPDQQYARQELLKYLSESIDVREPTGLYTLTRSGLQEVHDFATDPHILLAALHQLNGNPDPLLSSSVNVSSSGTSSPAVKSSDKSSVKSEAGKLQDMLQEAEQNFRSYEQRLAITYTLEGMQQLAQALAGFPGRKSLIWASGGFPFTVTADSMGMTGMGPNATSSGNRDSLIDVLPMYERTWQLLNNAQVSLYPVDVKGLRVAMRSAAAPPVNSSSMRNPGKANSAPRITSRQIDTQSTFQTFAAMTGGRAYYNSNDLVKGFRDAVADSSQYYMLGYYLDRSKTKSGWRKLTVKVNRDHTEVRARTGFFVTDATLDPEASRTTDISTALHSPLDFTSLALLAQWDKILPGKDPGIKRVTYHIHLSPDAGVINEQDSNHVVLDFVALPIASDGKAAGEPQGQKLDLHLTAEKLAAIRQRGVLYNGALDLPPGNYTVRFVVRDDLTGRTGSVSGPLEVQ